MIDLIMVKEYEEILGETKIITTDIRINDKEIELIKSFITQTLNYTKKGKIIFSDIPSKYNPSIEKIIYLK